MVPFASRRRFFGRLAAFLPAGLLASPAPAAEAPDPEPDPPAVEPFGFALDIVRPRSFAFHLYPPGVLDDDEEFLEGHAYPLANGWTVHLRVVGPARGMIPMPRVRDWARAEVAGRDVATARAGLDRIREVYANHPDEYHPDDLAELGAMLDEELARAIAEGDVEPAPVVDPARRERNRRRRVKHLARAIGA